MSAPGAHREGAVSAGVGPALDALVVRLAGPETAASLARDPYWPKWDSPWWWLTLLVELGEARRIPREAIVAFARAVRGHYLPHFPIHAHELPPGTDPYRHIACHCALGTAYRVLAAWGAPVDQLLPGARAWYVRYQLEDGGLNCDEGAYTRPVRRSSVVSTLPVLEALLAAPGPLTPAEQAALDAGAAYLLERRLFRSVSRGGAPIDAAWLQPIFPRFYEYDVLRGARLVTRWALRRGAVLPEAAIAEALAALAAWAAAGCRPRRWHDQAGTLVQQAGLGWAYVRPATSFALLEAVSDPARANPWLQREWNALQADLAALHARGLLEAAPLTV